MLPMLKKLIGEMMVDEELTPEEEAALQEHEAKFTSELASLINRYSLEKTSGTPDYILAEYLTDCLESYNKTVVDRDKWHLDGIVKKANSRGE